MRISGIKSKFWEISQTSKNNSIFFKHPSQFDLKKKREPDFFRV